MERVKSKVLITVITAFIFSMLCEAQEFTVAMSEDGIYGYKAKGEWIIGPQFEYAEPFSEGLAVVRVDGMYGYIDMTGNVVIEARYQGAGRFSYGLASVYRFGKYGYIDKKGKAVTAFKYDYAEPFREGLAVVSRHGKTAYIGLDGKTVVPFMLDAGNPFSYGLAEVRIDGVTKYVDKTGNFYADRSEYMRKYSGFARYFIEDKVNSWQRKGRHEKTSDWKRRVNNETRNALVDSLTELAQREYISYMLREIDNHQLILNYDPDGEVFLVQDSYFGPLLVPVPLDEAESFERGFSSARKNPHCVVYNDGIALREMTWTLPDGSSYRYDNSADLTFAMVDIDYEFDEIDYNALSNASPYTAGGNQNIAVTTLTAGVSDVDTDIPVSEQVNSTTFAVIIANEDYQRESDVAFALNDGKVFGEYCKSALGIPEQNIHIVRNATLNNILAEVDWLGKVAEAYQGEAGLIFYYAGHGMPDESSRDAYILPVDGYASNVATGYKLQNLYSSLAAFPTKYAYVFLDACFSGSERGDAMLSSARGIAVRVRHEVPKGNVIVFSAAQGDETAYPYDEKGHGMFTYFLLKKIQESGPGVTLGELSDYVRTEVRKQSVVFNSKMQTPDVTVPVSLQDTWKDRTFY